MPTFNSTLRSLIAAAMLIVITLSACKKGDNQNSANVSYAPLGEQRVNGLTGSALNGDLLGRAGDGAPLRYRETTGNWEHVGTTTGITNPILLSARSEDGGGNFYGQVQGDGNWWLPSGTTTWIRFPSPDPDTPTFDAPYISYPYANSTGDLVMQTHTHRGGSDHLRIYRKMAGSTVWQMASERGLDYYNINSFSDNGSVFLNNTAFPDNSPLVLRSGSNALVQMTDCGGVVLHPYCGLNITTNAAGEAVFLGNIYKRSLYKLGAGASYPTSPQFFCEMPEAGSSFNGGEALLPDGTFVARMNNGTYDPYHLYIRKSGGSNWIDGGLLPGEDGSTPVQLFATRKGDLFTLALAGFGLGSTGVVNRVRF